MGFGRTAEKWDNRSKWSDLYPGNAVFFSCHDFKSKAMKGKHLPFCRNHLCFVNDQSRDGIRLDIG
jgi:hypothetical protein